MTQPWLCCHLKYLPSNYSDTHCIIPPSPVHWPSTQLVLLIFTLKLSSLYHNRSWKILIAPSKNTPTHICLLATWLCTYSFIRYFLIDGYIIHTIFRWPSSTTNINTFTLILFVYGNMISPNVFLNILHFLSQNTLKDKETHLPNAMGNLKHWHTRTQMVPFWYAKRLCSLIPLNYTQVITLHTYTIIP